MSSCSWCTFFSVGLEVLNACLVPLKSSFVRDTAATIAWPWGIKFHYTVVTASVVFGCKVIGRVTESDLKKLALLSSGGSTLVTARHATMVDPETDKISVVYSV